MNSLLSLALSAHLSWFGSRSWYDPGLGLGLALLWSGSCLGLGVSGSRSILVGGSSPSGPTHPTSNHSRLTGKDFGLLFELLSLSSRSLRGLR